MERALAARGIANVLAAEDAARALVTALAPWGAPPASGEVVWWAVPRKRYGYVMTDTRTFVVYALPFAFHEVYEAASEDERGDGTYLGHAARWAPIWDRLLPGKPNPFRPLATIEAAGFAGLEWTGRHGEAFVVLLVDDGRGAGAP